MIIFRNNGVMDVRGITTFGTSVKENANAIGYFGTGLKYAIAVILRLGGKISISAGKDFYEFTTKSVEIRGKVFQLVLMNGEELSFTTELGKNWQLWQAYRELYCNAQDEGGEVLQEYRVLVEEGVTQVCVEMEEFNEVHYSKHEFILGTELLYKLNEIELHACEDQGAIFYRNIKIYQPKKRLMFNYNITNHVELTEDRSLKYAFMFDVYFLRSLIECEDAELIYKILSCEDQYQEATLNTDFIKDYKPNATFLTTALSVKKLRENVQKYTVTHSGALTGGLPISPMNAAAKRRVEKAIKSLGFEFPFAVVTSEYVIQCKSMVQGNAIYLNQDFLKEKVTDIAVELLVQYCKMRHSDKAMYWLAKQYLELKKGK